MRDPRLLVFGMVALSALGWTSPLRADAPPNRYELRACGTIVYDTKTKLEWQRAFNDRRDVGEAAGICGTLNLGGGGWRLPTILELVSIQDNTAANPMIDARFFPNTPSFDFATSSQPKGASIPPTYWMLNFGSGIPGTAKSRDPNAVIYSRCVRNPT